MVPAGEAILSGAGSDIRILSHIPKRSEIYSHPLVYGCQKKTPHGQRFRASFVCIAPRVAKAHAIIESSEGAYSSPTQILLAEKHTKNPAAHAS